MAAQIMTSIKIQANPSKVWQILTDFDQFPQWNPFLTEISGDVKVGNKIKINAGGMIFKPKVLVFKENEAFEWLGNLLFPGIFDGKHRFRLIDHHDGSCTFEHSEQFSGILVPIFKGKMLRQTKANFEKMNQALKEKAERL